MGIGMEVGMMKEVYVIDTETSTTHWTEGIPNGHIVEIGVAKVNLEKFTVLPAYQFVVSDSSADPEAWVFKNTDLTYDMVRTGTSPGTVSAFLEDRLKDKEVTSYNIQFDKMMIDRDMPYLNNVVDWGMDLMIQAANVPEIPRKHAGKDTWPKAEDSYNYLCPSDPCNLHGKEKHRALADAEMEGHILLELYFRGLYRMKEEE